MQEQRNYQLDPSVCDVSARGCVVLFDETEETGLCYVYERCCM